MKRMIDYIKNLFGADVRLRKWSVEQAIRVLPDSLGNARDYLADASRIEEYVKSAVVNDSPARSKQEHLGNW
jgi:hypothetical protein